MTTKDDIATAIYDCHYGALSAFAQARVDRLHREANKGMFEQAPQFQTVNVNERTAEQLKEELESLRDENAELWEENETLKLANMELERRNSKYADRDSWLAGYQQDGTGTQTDSEI